MSNKYRTALEQDFNRQKFNDDQKTCILGRFDKLANVKGDAFAFRIFYSSYGSRDDVQEKLDSIASVDCANALTHGAQQIYKALKSNKRTIEDSDVRKWHGISELDVDIFHDTKLRFGLWQTEERFNSTGVLERKRVCKQALASERGNEGLELVVLY